MKYTFTDRHNGPHADQAEEMLKAIGAETIDELVRQTVPEDILLDGDLPLAKAVDESDYTASLREIAAKNKCFKSMIGMGFYRTSTPAVIARNIFENPSWYTSYTPYQAEISQGRLEALMIFQTMISSLTGFSLANCSMLDDATAAAEAMRMMFNLRSKEAVAAKKNLLFVDKNIFPNVLSVLKTRAGALGIDIEVGDYSTAILKERCFGAMVQYPAANGEIRDYAPFCQKAHERGILVTAYCDLMALAIFKEPAAWGADIAVGTSQRFGLPMGFGGPTAGFMATKDEYKRFLPGRIIGASVDRLGNRAYRLALQTREQHIKRERATSNICTASALMAIMTGMFAVWHGPAGIRSIAHSCTAFAHRVAAALEKNGYRLACRDYFDTLEVLAPNVESIRARALENGFNFFYPDSNTIRISFDELSREEDIQSIGEIFQIKIPRIELDTTSPMLRQSEILTSPVFNTYHSETEMMRFIKKLERKDISLTHSMIPLGSCTMKLNAAVEMMPLGWHEFADVHPYAPKDQVAGTMQIIKDLEHDLAVITGFNACSLQPNSGAAGEYAGLMTIRNYFRATGQTNRNIMIIPTSAHGTNPASAAMAGFDIEAVSCDENGNIMVDELAEKAAAAGANLAGMMITYPSTHGVFEVQIRRIMDIIHEQGGMVYMDGANMNAQVGLTSPGHIGADICHLNLHKTFAMPHGGGGPGVGPICCTSTLAPYLPGHPVVEECGGKGMTSVSASPYGSPLLLLITHAYIKLLGPDGLRRVSQMAILNANYISKKLQPEFSTLYTGATGRVAHECIIDLRHFKAEYGVDATDVAKRLMDFGFHAPTLSFPVHETLMVEPTESEPVAELDRFVEALMCIKAECEAIKAGTLDAKDNPLTMAPHAAIEIAGDNWSHPYGREQAAYPLEWIKDNKFWPASARVENGLGDRNLIATL
ncbi:MAG: aminomethyl-transferring glycine dehydrogenase [Bacteroidales bacterium]|nr:aminomethyl-transferring glycine dehydrogenase [Candidatus Equibacterium intestinale]